MSKHRKTKRSPGDQTGSGKSFPTLPVITLAIGAGLYLTFSGVLKKADSSAPAGPPVDPPPTAGTITVPPPNPLKSTIVDGGATLADMIPSELELTDEERLAELVNRGTDLYHEGNCAGAVTNYAAAVALNPEDESAHFNLASALVKLGKNAEAMAEYLEALRVFPDYSEAHNNVGNLLAGAGRLAEAAEHIATAVKLTPDSASAHNNLGTVLIRQGKVKEAIGHFSEAAQLMPEYLEARCNLGNALLGLGKFAEAEAKFEEALKIKADFEPAKQGLARVARARQAPPLAPNSPVPLR